MPFETSPQNHNHGANSTVMQWLAADGPTSAAQLELTSVTKCTQIFMRHFSQPVAEPGSLAKPAASVKAVSDTQLQHAQRPAAQHSDLAGLSAQAVSQPEQVQAGRAGASADSSGQLSHSKQVQLQSWLQCLAVRTCFPFTDINLVQTANVCHKCIRLQRLTLHRTVSVQRIWPKFVTPTQTLTVDCVSSF